MINRFFPVLCSHQRLAASSVLNNEFCLFVLEAVTLKDQQLNYATGFFGQMVLRSAINVQQRLDRCR